MDKRMFSLPYFATTTVMAVSWDHGRLLYVVARVNGQSIQVVKAGSTQIDVDRSPAKIGKNLSEELAHLRINKVKLLLGIPRSQVEMLELELPPASDADLLSLVPNEVARRISDLSDESVVDFVRLNDDPSKPRRVDAAVLRPEVMAHFKAVCDAAGQSATQMVLRPYAIASLFARIAGRSHHKCLLVNVLEHDVDMSVFSQGHVVFSRTVRITSDQHGRPGFTQLADEIRRTIAVAPDASDAEEAEAVEHIYMFDNLKADNQTVGQLADELDLPVSVLDPFADVQGPSGPAPGQAHRFSALIGMLRDYADRAATIDFMNPKRPPSKAGAWRKIAFYSTAAAVVVALLTGHVRSELKSIRSDNEVASAELERAQQLLDKLKSKTAIVDAVNAWRSDDINWLDEMRDLSVRFPPGHSAMVQRMTMAPSSRGGVISMSVRVRDPSIVSEMESGLRDGYHRVNSKRVAQADQTQDYPCQFETSVVVQPRPKASYNEE